MILNGSSLQEVKCSLKTSNLYPSCTWYRGFVRHRMGAWRTSHMGAPEPTAGNAAGEKSGIAAWIWWKWITFWIATQRNLRFPTEPHECEGDFWWMSQTRWIFHVMECRAVDLKKTPLLLFMFIAKHHILMSWVIESLPIEIRRFKKGRWLAQWVRLRVKVSKENSFIPSSKCTWWMNEPKRFPRLMTVNLDHFIDHGCCGRLLQVPRSNCLVN